MDLQYLALKQTINQKQKIMIKKILYILILFPLICLGQWTQVANYPTTGVSMPFCFTVAGKAYMGCGYNISYSPTVNNFEYNPTTDSWSPKSIPPFTARMGMFSFSIGSFGYVGSGSSNGGISLFTDFWRYDPTTDTWSAMAPFPGQGRIEAATFVVGSKGYVVSGINSYSNLRDCWQYNPATNSWLAMSNPPLAFKPGYVIGFAYGNSGFVGLGGVGNNASNDFWKFDTTNNSWSQMASLPSIPANRGYTIGGTDLVTGKGFVGLGTSGGTILSDFWSYDFVMNTWSQQPPLYDFPIQMGQPRTFNLNGETYVGTGAAVPITPQSNKMYKFICNSSDCTQSRGIRYTWQNFSSILSDYLPNWSNNNSSTYVIGNEDVVVVTPMIEQNSNYFTMLTRYDKKLCYKGNTKIAIPNTPAGYTDIFLNGTSKNDGGFALVSNSYPYIVRNYNSQGALLFSKKISCPMNPSYTSSGAKIVANPYNNNLYVIFEDLEPVANFDPFVNVYGSPVVKVVELSTTGTLVNAFKVTIPYDTIYPYKNTNIYNIFDFPAGNLIADATFVKGSPSTIAQDRIWLSLNLDYARSYEIDTTTNQVLGLIINNYLVGHTSYPAILATNPQGTLCTTDIVKTYDNSSNAKLAVSKRSNFKYQCHHDFA